ncbi:MAG: type II toxin-antitoxin system HicB family antitoxin [Oscillospiraceae bacterium]|jgi:predicted RNase H-like HicB family nuclease|nr:type II toxin-antitoxin system HicB family antitoxin [Oscillospiraceae bacterium]
MKLNYPARFYKEDDGYGVIFVDLDMCYSQGKNLNDAITMASEAAEGWLLTGLIRGDSIPEPSNPSSITTQKEYEQIIVVPVDVDKLLSELWQTLTEKYRSALTRVTMLQTAQ